MMRVEKLNKYKLLNNILKIYSINYQILALSIKNEISRKHN
jgi:hypothetical protein